MMALGVGHCFLLTSEPWKVRRMCQEKKWVKQGVRSASGGQSSKG